MKSGILVVNRQSKSLENLVNSLDQCLKLHNTKKRKRVRSITGNKTKGGVECLTVRFCESAERATKCLVFSSFTNFSRPLKWT